MTYSIKEVAVKMNIPASTIRYYDKEGLLLNIKRTESGYRVFDEADLEFLELIDCLKRTGLSIKEIKQFSQWLEMGDTSLHNRYALFCERKKVIMALMQDLQRSLDLVDHKCKYYESAIKNSAPQ